eukprot:15329571-Ditylum_brightwellii.AAC.1
MKRSHVAEKEIIEWKYSMLEKETNQLKTIRAQDQSSIKALEDEFARLKKMVTSLEMELNQERTKFENTYADLQNELSQSEGDKNFFQEAKAAMGEKCAEMQKELSQYRTVITRQESMKEALQAELKLMKARCTALQKETESNNEAHIEQRKILEAK